MAFTVASTFLDDLARRRARAEALSRTSTKAALGAADILGGVEKRDAEAKIDARDAGLRLRTQEANEANVAADNARAAAEAARMADKDEFDRGLRLRDADHADAAERRTVEDRTRTTESERRKRLLDAEVAALDGARIDRAAAEAIATRTGASVEEVMGAVTAAAGARSERNAAADLKTRQTEAQIELDQANAARARRPPAAAVPKPPSAYDEARIKALQDKQHTATVATMQDVQAARKKLARLDKIIADKSKFNTGPAADAAASVVGALMPDPSSPLFDVLPGRGVAQGFADRTTWKSNVMKDLNAIIKEQAGAAVSASEMTRALAAELHTGLDDAAFNQKAQEVRESYARDLADAEARLTPETRARIAPTVGTIEGNTSSGIPDAAALAAMAPEDLDDLTPEQLAAILAAGGG